MLELKHKYGWAVALLAALGLWVFLLWPQKPPAEPAPLVSKRAAPLVPKLSNLAWREEPAEELNPQGPELVVDEVLVEKREVCEGEENLISVRAHTNNSTDGYLRAVALGQGTGMQIPVKAYIDGKGRTTIPEVRLFGRDDAVLEVQVPPFIVKRCPPQAQLLVAAALMPNTTTRYRLHARVRQAPARADSPKPFEAVRYEWSFGDGSSLTTLEPVAEHEFALRSSVGLYASFLVKVTATNVRAQSISARSGVEIYNRAFDARDRLGVVLVNVSMEPRYAQVANGVVRQRFRLSHQHDTAVKIERIRGKWLKENVEEEIPFAGLIGADVIHPGQSIEFEMTVDTRSRPRFYGFNGDIAGKSNDGLPARGMFSLMRPSEPPTAERHTPVADPALSSRIERAMALLKQQHVSDEDLLGLERQGKFHDLPPLMQQTASLSEPPPALARRRSPSSPAR